MNTSNKSDVNRTLQISLLLLLICPGFSNRVVVRAQKITDRTVVLETNRQEMDTLLLRKPITATLDNSARRALLKQINDDFRELQLMNNKLMAEVTTPKEVDYKFISGMIAQIGSRAARLKTNLALPKSEAQKESQVKIDAIDRERFKKALITFDRVVMSFVTNPIFQKTNVIELDLANRASSDLATIIEQSGRLKKLAAKLARVNK